MYVDEFLEQKRATPTVDPVMQRAERAMEILDDFLEKSATKSPKVLLCSAMPARLPLSSSSALQELCTAFGCIPLTHDANVTPPQLYQSCALRLGAFRLCILTVGGTHAVGKSSMTQAHQFVVNPAYT